MSRAAVIAILLVASLQALPAAAPRRGWFVEGAVGLARLTPADLNARPESQQRRIDFLYRQGYEALQRVAGGAFSYQLTEPEGSGLHGLGNGFPLRLRVGRAIGPRLVLFAGLEFLGRQRTSFLAQAYTVSDLRPDQVTPPGTDVVDVGFPEIFLEARAWLPQLGASVDLYRKGNWTAALRLAAGPMLAAVRLCESQYYKRTEADGYWTEWRQVVDMKGRGTGMAFDAAARLALALSPRLGLFVEGGYALRRGSRFSGPGTFSYQYRDANATQNPQRLQWDDGEWRVRGYQLQRDWGELSYFLSGNDPAGDADSRRFRLDLSGWQLALGLSLAL